MIKLLEAFWKAWYKLGSNMTHMMKLAKFVERKKKKLQKSDKNDKVV